MPSKPVAIRLSEYFVVLLEYVFLFFGFVRRGGMWFTIGGLLEDYANHLTLIISCIPILISILILLQRYLATGTFLLDKQNWFSVSTQSFVYSPLIWILSLIACFLLSIVSGSNINASIYYFFPAISMLVLLLVERDKDFLEALIQRFCNVVTIGAVVSLVFWCFGSVFQIIEPSGYVISDWFEWRVNYPVPNYYHVYYEPQKFSLLGINGIRNCAVFNEAPMFAFPLCVAFALEALYRKEPSPTRLSILGLGVLSNFSITALTALSFCVGYLFIKRFLIPRLSNERKKPVIVVSVFIFLLMAAFFLSTKLGTNSFAIRADHFTGCIRAFIDNLPFGTGFGDSEIYLFQYLSRKQGLSVGIPVLLAQCGLLSIITFFFPVALFAWRCVRKRMWDELAFLALFLWILLITNVYNSLVCWFLLVFLFFGMPASDYAPRECSYPTPQDA